MLTAADKNLLIRVARCLEEQADDLERGHGANWALDAAHKKAKRDHDRLRREARDVTTFRKRLQAMPPMVLSVGVGHDG